MPKQLRALQPPRAHGNMVLHYDRTRHVLSFFINVQPCSCDDCMQLQRACFSPDNVFSQNTVRLPRLPWYFHSRQLLEKRWQLHVRARTLELRPLATVIFSSLLRTTALTTFLALLVCRIGSTMSPAISCSGTGIVCAFTRDVHRHFACNTVMLH